MLVSGHNACSVRASYARPHSITRKTVATSVSAGLMVGFEAYAEPCSTKDR